MLFWSNSKARRVLILQKSSWKKQGHIWRIFVDVLSGRSEAQQKKEQLLVDTYKSSQLL